MGWAWSWDTWFILAQVMGLVTICIEFVSYQIKNQRKYLLVTSIANIFWAMMFLFMGFHTAMSSVFIMIVAALFGTLRGMIFWWIFAKNTRKRKIIGRVALYASLLVMLPFTIMAIVKLPLTTQIIIQTLGLATGLLFIVGQYLPSKHYLRLFTFMYATMVLIGSTPLNLIDEAGNGYWNYSGILIELSKIVSIIVFYTLLIWVKRAAIPEADKQLEKTPLPRSTKFFDKTRAAWGFGVIIDGSPIEDFDEEQP